MLRYECTKNKQRLGLYGALRLIQNATYEICEGTPESLFPRARNISNEFTDGDALSHFLVHLELPGAPEPDKLLRDKCTPAVALLAALY